MSPTSARSCSDSASTTWLDVDRARQQEEPDAETPYEVDLLDALVFTLEQAVWLPGAALREINAVTDEPQGWPVIFVDDDVRRGELGRARLEDEEGRLEHALAVARRLRSLYE